MEGPARPIALSWVVPGGNRATCKRRPVMDKDTTYVALDDSKRKIVAGILRPRDAEPELREIVNDPRQIRRLLERLKREGPVAACYEPGVSAYDLHRRRSAATLSAGGIACSSSSPAMAVPTAAARTGARGTGGGSASSGSTCPRCSARSRLRCSRSSRHWRGRRNSTRSSKRSRAPRLI